MRKLVVIIIGFFLLIPSIPFFNQYSATAFTTGNNTIDIYVAIHNNDERIGQGTAEEFFPIIEGYNWIVGNTTYNIHATYTGMDELGYAGGLDQFTVFVIAGGHDENIWFAKRNNYQPYETDPYVKKPYTVGDMKNHLEEFISNGGGYIGHCGGSSMALGYDHSYQTLSELLKNRDKFLIDPGVQAHEKILGEAFLAEYLYFDEYGIPRFCFWPFQNEPDPTRMGSYAYIYYSGMDPTNMSHHISGDCIDLVLRDKEDPLFKGYFDDTWRVRWISGPAFRILPGSQVSRLADYPSNALENNASVAINAWSWDSPWIDLIHLAFEALDSIGSDDPNPLFNLIGAQPMLDFEWTSTTKPIITDLANYPGLVSFPYHDGRCIMCGLHPEDPIWYGGHIDDLSSPSTLRDGLHNWVDDQGNPLDYNEIMQFHVNDWFVRREVAWASKLVPDTSLPPVYGRSQVVDISPELQEEQEFTIDCCVGKEKDETWNTQDLSLYYRYNDSGTWTDWTYYNSITSMPYQFTFDAYDTGYGSGEYQFYSILNTTNATGYYCESPPPGPDAQCVVDTQALVADFTYEPIVAYTNDTVTFTDQSMSINATIDSYEWTFEEGTPQSGPTVYQTWTQDGTYTVTLTIENNTLSETDTKSKEITILNQLPIANFTVEQDFIKIGEPLNFTDTSTDPDGTVVNWTWDFGDGNISYDQNPTFSYEKGNLYTVTLMATDNDGGSDIHTQPACVLVVDAVVNQSLPENLPDEHEWNTIHDALTNTSYRDIIFVHSATYQENLVVDKSKILMGENKHNTIIDGSVLLTNAHDFELPNYGILHWVINMSGTNLLYHFNNDSEVGENYSGSTVVYDYSGYGQQGKSGGPVYGTNNGATWTTNSKKGDGAFEFNGINNSISLSSIPALTEDSLTVSAWIYWEDDSGTIAPVFVQTDENGDGYQLYINCTTKKPVFQLDDSKAISTETLTTNQWYHLIGTYNGNTLQIYVDGQPTGSTQTTGVGVSASAYIGCDNDSQYFNGIIDEVCVWERPLSDDEIYRTYDYNYGVHLEGFTIRNSTTGVTACNRSISQIVSSQTIPLAYSWITLHVHKSTATRFSTPM